MSVIDLLALWNWEPDADFIWLLGEACAKHGVSYLALNEHESEGVADQLAKSELTARAVLDRSWDVMTHDHGYEQTITKAVNRVLNPYDAVRKTTNKPSMHYLLMQHGFHVPFLLVLPSVHEAPTLTKRDLSPLGRQFSIKGAHGGGSGVLHPTTSWEDIERQRHDWPDDETILQAWVTPCMMGVHPAWFRMFYTCGEVSLCWANDRTHVQTLVSPDEERMYDLSHLRGTVLKVAELTGLNAFSTEIAKDEHNVWKVVDYVNEPCDYRLQSSVYNGVPDIVVKGTAEAMARWAKQA